tara:strand:- start:404 stop:802 length:399 start_codon:yes stop_codon:yes gene_type:complete
MAYGSDVGRRIADKFAYFIRGRQVIIVEFPQEGTISTGDAPLYTAPSEGLASGLMLEYTAIPDIANLLNETDTIPLNDTLSLALVDYIRAALIDSPELIQQREYYMTRFRNRVAKYVTARVGGQRRIIQRNL